MLFFVIFVIVFGFGLSFDFAEAIIGDSCVVSSDCVLQPSGCHLGFCTGPCIIDANCLPPLAPTFLNDVGWTNAKCLGDLGPPVVQGICVEASAFGVPSGAPTTVQESVGIVANIADWIFNIFLIVALIFVVLAAAQFVTRAGNPEALNQARRKLIWAAVGIGVALLARGFEIVLRDLLGVS